MVSKQTRQVLDDYRLERILRSTVWTTVLRAVEPDTERPVVLKLIHAAGPVAEEANRSRFNQVMSAAQRGSFPGLPRVLDFGFTPEGDAFLVNEPVDGGVALGALRAAPPSFVAPALVRVLDTVDELAMAGVAHLNLSLDNVLVMDRSVRVVGNGTGPYLVGAPSGIWPQPGARCAAPELYGRGVLQRDDLWLADLYAIAMMACDALGAEVEGVGSARPVVHLDALGMGAVDEFETVMALALRRDPGARAVSVSELREVLLDRVRVDVPQEAEDRREAPSGIGAGGEDGASPTAAVTGSGTVSEVAGGTRMATRSGGQRPSPVRLAILVAAALAAVLAGSLTTLALLSRSTQPSPPEAEASAVAVATVPVPTPVPREVVLTPTPTADPRLEEAERLLSEGDRDGARSVLDDISEEDLGRLPPEAAGRLEELRAALESVDRGEAVGDLRGGLEAGSIAMLRRAVAALGDLDAGELRDDPDLRENLEHARAALEQHRELWDAQRGGDLPRVVEAARRMIALLPGYSGAYRLREEAATSLEAEAAEAASGRDFAGALALAEPLRRAWPEREGLAERIAAWKIEQERDRKLDQVLERALAEGRRGRPDAGLQLLAGSAAEGAPGARLDAVRGELSAELARLDAHPPVVSVPEDLELRYRKNETVVVPITVTDDFRVERVVVHIKTGPEPSYRELPLVATGGDLYTLSIPPEVHGNGRVLFWVEAVDVSGHRGDLGEVTAPLELERKRWYQR